MKGVRVGEVMVARVITVGPRDALEEVMEAMVRSNISGVVVADVEGRVQGIISHYDLLARVVADPGRWRRTEAREIMRPKVSIGPEKTLEEAARLMVENRVPRLVVEGDGELRGIITIRDIVWRLYMAGEG